LSTRRKSSTTRIAPYQAPNVRVSTPSRRGLRDTAYSSRNSSVAEIMSYSAVWCRPIPVEIRSPVAVSSVAPLRP
jgi:hypothetical protein